MRLPMLILALALTLLPGGSALAQGKSEGAGGPAQTQKATFAGGCFWCMEHPFDELPGVISVTSGYTGGTKKNPTYEEVSAGGTGHAESVQIAYDPAKISYQKLLDVYWHNIDPTVKNRQFCDVGTQYRSAIFYHDEEQHRLALQSKEALQKSGVLKAPIQTEVVAASQFYPAEGYHQHYYKKNPLRYKFYRTSCGRDARLRELWGEKAALSGNGCSGSGDGSGSGDRFEICPRSACRSRATDTQQNQEAHP